MISDAILYGIFALSIVDVMHLTNIPWHEIARTPFAINLGILFAFIVPGLAQGEVRDKLIKFSLLFIFIMTGLVFTGLMILAAVLVFYSSRILRNWAIRSGNHVPPLIVGWLLIVAMYSPLFFINHPAFDGYMSWGELVLLWGPGYMTLKCIHYTRVCIQDVVDSTSKWAFKNYLHYLVHFPSFWFGPFQNFKSFTSEVATCKQRINRETRNQGLRRIGIGVIKFVIIFHYFNVPYLYKLDYFGPFTDKLFADAATADPGHLWFAAYVLTLRFLLFISAISDGVIGMNLLIGIRMRENSNWPFFATNIRDFWRRWNIQTGYWLKQEVFNFTINSRMPIFAYLCVFLFSGFWHFPSTAAVFGYAVLNVGLIQLTKYWQSFWQRHAKLDDQIYRFGVRYKLCDSWIANLFGMLLVFHSMVFSTIFLFDHFHSGTLIVPRMFGF